VRDVDAEAGDAAVEPVAEDAVELVADILVPPVEVRLGGREVVQIVGAAFLVPRPRGAAAERGAPVVRDLPRPDVEVGPLVEPRMRDRGVVRHQV
jgi:hypothetical protein